MKQPTDTQKCALAILCERKKPVRLCALNDGYTSTGTMDQLEKKGLARSIKIKGIRHWFATPKGRKLINQ